MKHLWVLVLALSASAAQANTVGCGENANTYAEVVSGPQSKGPIVSVPDSLCADLIEDRRPTTPPISIQIGPSSAAPSPAPRPRRGRD